jgi:GTP-binding protein Era
MTTMRCGYVAMIGRPNVGKSTLLNCLIGEKLSIISPKPQTTRWQILGIKTLANAQIIYIDTPGMHNEEKRAMNRYMNRVANSVIDGADVIVFVVDALKWKEEDSLVLSKLEGIKQPVILAINKVDLVKDKTELLPWIERIKEKFAFTHIVPISALKADNTDMLEKEITSLLPFADPIYPEDQLTDRSVKFLVGEIIREKLIQLTGKELPYTTTVEIEQYKEVGTLTEIGAVIWVERDGQRVIIIGKKGAKLKKIGIQARRDIEELIGSKVFLSLWVKVKSGWTDDERALKGLGYE